MIGFRRVGGVQESKVCLLHGWGTSLLLCLPTKDEIPIHLWPTRNNKTVHRYSSWVLLSPHIHRQLKARGKEENSGESQRCKAEGDVGPCSCWQWVDSGGLPSALWGQGLIWSWLLPSGLFPGGSCKYTCWCVALLSKSGNNLRGICGNCYYCWRDH